MRTSHEARRGCGFRKGGGLYLVTDGIGVTCDALPIPTEVCPACGHGIKPSRGWTWIDPDLMLSEYLRPHGPKLHSQQCPLSDKGRLGERCGLLWIGEGFYPTPQDWILEGMQMGFSRRISGVPRGFEIGQTWVLAGHRKAVEDGYVTGDGQHFDSLNELLSADPESDQIDPVFKPGIFHVWRPTRIEYVVKGTETEKELEALEKRGIEPVKVIPIESQTELREEEGR